MIKTVKEIQMDLSKDENDLIEMFVVQRIDTLVLRFKKEYPQKEETEMIEAEKVFHNLDADKREKIDYLLTSTSKRLFEEQKYIYKQGVADGIKIMRQMIKI